MKIVFFAHPSFLGSQSMPRFVHMLAEGMRQRGHETEVWQPEAKFSKLPVGGFKKWMSYIDQYIVFPGIVKKLLKTQPADTLYVVTDHALGPYIPLIADRLHVIHCHDFLAQRSALGEIPENITSASGKKYQAYIKNGYSKGRNFISVSEKTRTDLERFMAVKPERSEMVYNGLNPAFAPAPENVSRLSLGKELNLDLANGYILHVGGNQWYKNRIGVIAIYDAWRKKREGNLPLLLIGPKPAVALEEKRNNSDYKNDIHFIVGVSDEVVKKAYAGASVFLFPSIAEGFGWPIAEAMASGAVVITTNEAPMLEVAGAAALLIDRRPPGNDAEWAEQAAVVLQQAVQIQGEEKKDWIERGVEHVKQFNLEHALNRIEEIYKEVLTAKS